MSEIRNIFYDSDNESFNESDFEKSEEELFSDPEITMKYKVKVMKTSTAFTYLL